MEAEETVLRRQLASIERRIGELERFERYGGEKLEEFPLPKDVDVTVDTALALTLSDRIHSELSTQEALEDSLRSEVLQTERQRAYISVLTQAITDRLLTTESPCSFHQFISLPTLHHDTQLRKLDILSLQTTLSTLEIEEQNLQLTLDLITPIQTKNLEAITEIDENGKKIEEMEGQMEQLKTEIKSLKEYLDGKNEVESKFEEIKSENEALKCDFEARNEKNNVEIEKEDELMEKMKEKMRLKRNFEELKSENEEEKRELENYFELIKKSEAETEKIKTDLKELEEKRNSLESQINSLKTFEIELNSSISQLEESLKASKSALDVQFADIKRLSTDLFNHSLLENSLQSHFSGLNSEINSVYEAINTIKIVKNELNLTIKRDFERSKLEIEGMMKEIQAVVLKSAAVIEDLQVVRRSGSDLQRELTELKEVGRELPRALHRESELRREIDRVKAAITATKREVEELVQVRSELRARLLSTSLP